MMEGSTILRIGLHKMIPLILSISLLTGCGKSVTDYVYDLASNTSDLVSDYLEETANNTPQHYAVETFDKVLELVQAKDCQAIYDMFSEYDKGNVNLMPEIEKLVEFMDGEVVEMRHVGASNDDTSVRDGKTLKAAYTASTYVTTGSGVLYWVKVGVVTDDTDEAKLGVYYIYILNSDAFDAYINERVEWDERQRNGIKEPEPERPDNIEVGVNWIT